MKTKQNLNVVGTNAHRVDAIEKVSGKAIYTSDIQLPGMAHARILRSPVAHEGGYHLRALAESLAASLAAMDAGAAREPVDGADWDTPSRGRAAVQQARAVQSAFWRGL